jgi:hypothetical protein
MAPKSRYYGPTTLAVVAVEAAVEAAVDPLSLSLSAYTPA